MIKQLQNENEFNQIIAKGDVLVDFSATWCGPCKMMEPNFEKLSDNYPNLIILQIDVDSFSNIAAKFNITSIPSLFLLKNGQVIKSSVGYIPYQSLERFIK